MKTISNEKQEKSLDVVIRKGTPCDGEDFVNLINIGESTFLRITYGLSTAEPLKNLFCSKKNLLSYEHSYFAEVGRENAGMICGYDWKTRKEEVARTRLLLIRYAGIHFMMKVPFLILNWTIPGIVGEGDYYMGNLVVYPQFRGRSVAKMLVLKMEDEARKKGAQRIVANTEVHNQVVTRMLKGMGYLVSDDPTEMKIGKYRLYFSNIEKKIQ